MNAVVQHDETTAEDAPVTMQSDTDALTPMGMIQTALANGAGMDVMERLFALQERWEGNEARRAFDAAIAAAKAEIPVISKNRTVDFTSAKGRTHYKHEDLGEIARVVSPILARHGLHYRFRTTSVTNEPISVTCILSHRQGHSEENTLHAGRDESGNKNNHQAIASAVTYLQRYTLKAALGLAAAEDDDAAKAGDGALITEEQVSELAGLLADADADQQAFLKWAGVERLMDLPSAKYGSAQAMLQTKLRKAKAAQEGGAE